VRITARFTRCDPQGVLNNEKALQMPSASAGFFIFKPFKQQAVFGLSIKNPAAFAAGLFRCSGGSAKHTSILLLSYFTIDYTKALKINSKGQFDITKCNLM
jgi:hypothetical protein